MPKVMFDKVRLALVAFEMLVPLKRHWANTGSVPWYWALMESADMPWRTVWLAGGCTEILAGIVAVPGTISTVLKKPRNSTLVVPTAARNIDWPALTVSVSML